MSFWDRLFGRKANPVGGINVTLTTPGRPVWTKQNYDALAREGYQRNPVVFAAITQIARSVAGIPLIAFNGDDPIEGDHPLTVLFQRPNARSGYARFMTEIVSHLYISGNAYVQSVALGQQVKELWPLRPDRTTPIPDGKGDVGAYEYKVGSNRTEIPAAEICHFRFFHPTDDWVGLSPLAVAARAIDQQNAGDDWNMALLQNHARPAGALVVDGELAPNEYEQLKKEIEEKYTGARNASRPLLLGNGFKWQQFSLSPSDLDWLDGDRASGLKIAMAMGVPPEIIGDSTSRTYSNYQEARQSFYTETVLPLLDLLLDDLNAWLAPAYQGARLGYQRDGIEAMQEDQNDVADRYRRLVDSGIWTPNEAREKFGMEPHPDGDALRQLQAPTNAPVTGTRSITTITEHKALLNGAGD